MSTAQVQFVPPSPRGLRPTVITQFRGLDIYTNLLGVAANRALDLLNVIVSGDGGLHKMRIPIALTPDTGGAITNGPSRYFDFQQAIGTRHIIGWQAEGIFRFDINAGYNFLLISNDPLNNSVWDFVTANNIAFGANGLLMKKWTGALWQNWGGKAPAVAPTFITAGGPVTLITGRSWKYSYKNSVTGHETSLSPASANTGPQVAKQFTLTPVAPTDLQFDVICWYATLDGGGDYFFESEEPVGNFLDTKLDVDLHTNRRGSLINNPPIVGKYLCEWNGRVFIAGLTGAAQDLIYSGYERIFVGRPEESFPPFNRLRLAIGADAVRGIGVIQAGVIAFDQSNKMYMFRGVVEDVTTSAPLLFSAYLEELPWQTGCFSHYTIASTPYGLVWLASDKTVQIYNGTNKPTTLSTSVTPLVRRITAGTEGTIKGTYFNWLDREWYALTMAVDGALQNNRLLFFDLNTDPAANAGIWVSDIEADDIQAVEDANGHRQLTISKDGRIYDCQLEGDAQGGITIKPTNTAGLMAAYWQGGYQDSDYPQKFKMYRFGHLIADVGGFRMVNRYINHIEYTIKAPLMQNIDVQRDGKFTMNKKMRLMSPTIVFPDIDASANVVQLITLAIPTSER